MIQVLGNTFIRRLLSIFISSCKEYQNLNAFCAIVMGLGNVAVTRMNVSIELITHLRSSIVHMNLDYFFLGMCSKPGNAFLRNQEKSLPNLRPLL